MGKLREDGGREGKREERRKMKEALSSMSSESRKLSVHVEKPQYSLHFI